MQTDADTVLIIKVINTRLVQSCLYWRSLPAACLVWNTCRFSVCVWVAEVLSWTGLTRVATIIKRRRLGLFGHVARLPSSTPANQILKLKMVTDHVQTGNALVEDPTPPGFTSSARTPAWLHLKLWSWRKIDVSGGQSQRWEATAEHYAFYSEWQVYLDLATEKSDLMMLPHLQVPSRGQAVNWCC